MSGPSNNVHWPAVVNVHPAAKEEVSELNAGGFVIRVGLCLGEYQRKNIL